MTLQRLVCCLLLSAAPLLHAVAASAEVSPADSAAARAIATGQLGLQAYERGAWREALARFREANGLYQSPVFSLLAARCQRRLGELLEARAELEQLVAQTLPADAPSPWLEAQADARLELSQLAAEVPHVTLLVEGGSPETQLQLDDRVVTPGRPIELNPGRHRVVATDGSRRGETNFDVVLRSRSSVKVSLGATPATPAQRFSKPYERQVPGETRRGYYLPGVLLATAGALALASGGVVGVLALEKRRRLHESLPQGCQHERCLESRRSVVEAHLEPARNLALACDVLWISGTVLAATGVTMILVDPRRDSAALSVQGRF